MVAGHAVRRPLACIELQMRLTRAEGAVGVYHAIRMWVRTTSSWFEPSSYTAAAIDSKRTITSLTTNGNADLIQTSNNRIAKTYALGGTVEWKPNSQLTVKAGVSLSRAKDSAGGCNYFTMMGIPSTYSFNEATGNCFPSTVNYSANLANAAMGPFAHRAAPGQHRG